MGYCTQTDIENVIAQALTSATASSPDSFGTLSSLINIGNSLDKNLVPDSSVDYYIQMADREVDASLSELYSTPFCELANFETVLFSDIYEYNPYIVTERACPLAVGDQVIILGSGQEERHVIDEVISSMIFSTEDEIGFSFTADSRVVRVSYPDPIRFISARKASATLYDKYFSSESSPNVSKFGEYLRQLAFTDTNNILNGTTILHGQHRIGRRFYNSNLVDQYGLPQGGAISKDMRQIK
jgi:hypothetical protein